MHNNNPRLPANRSGSTSVDWAREQARAKRTAYISAFVGVILSMPATVATMLLSDLLTSDRARYAVAAGSMAVLVGVLSILVVRKNLAQQRASDEMVRATNEQLSQGARRAEMEGRLANALDMAIGEPEVLDVIERSLIASLPESPVELKLADNSHAHLLLMASASPNGEPPGCTVDSPDHCPAALRAQVQRFRDSDDLDACPKLRGRPVGRTSAICVPVSIMGRAVGVIHATDQPGTAFNDDQVQDMTTLAKLAGTRIGLLRAMAESQLQAATDSLTGLLNRRSFDSKVSAMRRGGSLLSVAMADLDHFKNLNDTYGHEAGDRALRLFAQVLNGAMRSNDLVCRHGGEEFAIALYGCSSQDARAVLDGLRARLEAAITVAGMPEFTVSVGVVEAAADEDLLSLLARADVALFAAKRGGRNQVVVHDDFGHPVPAERPAPAAIGTNRVDDSYRDMLRS